MNHYTLNTGHNRHSPRDEVSQEALEACQELLSVGWHDVPGFDGYMLQVAHLEPGQGMTATLWFGRGERPCLTFATCLTEWYCSQVYESLLDVTPAPHPGPPPAAPCILVVVLTADPDEAFWAADFERCVAWAFAEAHGAP